MPASSSFPHFPPLLYHLLINKGYVFEVSVSKPLLLIASAARKLSEIILSSHLLCANALPFISGRGATVAGANSIGWFGSSWESDENRNGQTLVQTQAVLDYCWDPEWTRGGSLGGAWISTLFLLCISPKASLSPLYGILSVWHAVHTSFNSSHVRAQQAF